jgi:hypothetical protein
MSCADLFSEIRDSLPDGHEFGERELALLALSERQAADLASWRPTSPRGDSSPRAQRRVLNQSLAECRQGRVAWHVRPARSTCPTLRAEAGGTAR